MATPYALRSFEAWFIRGRPWWRTNLVHNTFGPLIYLLAMGGGLGSLVGHRHPEALGGMSYGEFVAPALLVAACMQAGVAGSTWPVLGALKWQRSYYAMVATPLSVTHIYLGHLMQMALENAVAASGFTLVALVLGYPTRMLLV
ncbi:MAG: hypothetical protein LC640_13570, partial [Frankia sp.]|nr:hypothetical protein [Frankia sp.]